MNRVRVKICGLNDPEAFDAALDAGADWVGFNFFPPSPRYVTPARAAELSARSPGGPPRVGLFVTASPEALAAEALHAMNAGERPITSLFVVDARGRPLGILHIHDLLRAGMA